MNLFVFHKSPARSAILLDDKRLNKLILESAQMLSTAIHFHKDGIEGIYKSSYIHHPVTKWVHKTRANYNWTLQYMKSLWVEKQYRFPRGSHKSALLIPIFEECNKYIPEGELTPFQNSAKNEKLGLDFTYMPVHKAYREYFLARLNMDKSPKWTNRNKDVFQSNT